MNKAFFVALVSLTLSACATPPIIMQDPKTGNIAQCSTADMYGQQNKWSNEQCAKGYEKGGWVRLNSDEKTP
jgi:hypothetical protein